MSEGSTPRALTRRAVLGRLGLMAVLPLLAACSTAAPSASTQLAATQAPTTQAATTQAATTQAQTTQAPTTPATANQVAPTQASAAGLKVGYLPITDAAPLLIAHARGFYKDNGLDAPQPTLFRSWAQIAEAFQARQVDVAHLLMPMVIQMRYGQNFPVKLVAWDHVNGSALTVAPDIQRVEDLAGTTVGIPFWFSIHNIVLQQLFNKAGLKPIIQGDPSVADRSVKLVIMAPPDMPPALGQGSIKGFIVAEPFNAVAETGQVGKILRFTGDVWRDHACCVVVMQEDVVQSKPDYVQATVTSVAQAQRYLRENRASVAELLSKDGQNYLPQPRDVIDRAMNFYSVDEYARAGAIQHPDWQNTRVDFQPFPYSSYTQQLVDWMKQTTVDGDSAFVQNLDAGKVQSELVAEQFARTAITAAGGASTFGIAESLTRTEQIGV